MFLLKYFCHFCDICGKKPNNLCYPCNPCEVIFIFLAIYLVVRNKFLNFAPRKEIIMERKKLQFTSSPGGFRDSIRAYRKYKKDWHARMEVKLAKIEEEIQQAKNNSYFEMV